MECVEFKMSFLFAFVWEKPPNFPFYLNLSKYCPARLFQSPKDPLKKKHFLLHFVPVTSKWVVRRRGVRTAFGETGIPKGSHSMSTLRRVPVSTSVNRWNIFDMQQLVGLDCWPSKWDLESGCMPTCKCEKCRNGRYPCEVLYRKGKPVRNRFSPYFNT